MKILDKKCHLGQEDVQDKGFLEERGQAVAAQRSAALFSLNY